MCKKHCASRNARDPCALESGVGLAYLCTVGRILEQFGCVAQSARPVHDARMYA